MKPHPDAIALSSLQTLHLLHRSAVYCLTSRQYYHNTCKKSNQPPTLHNYGAFCAILFFIHV
jgi:hypothetical protein